MFEKVSHIKDRVSTPNNPPGGGRAMFLLLAKETMNSLSGYLRLRTVFPRYKTSLDYFPIERAPSTIADAQSHWLAHPQRNKYCAQIVLTLGYGLLKIEAFTTLSDMAKKQAGEGFQ